MGLELAKAFVTIRADNNHLEKDFGKSRSIISGGVAKMAGVAAAASAAFAGVGAGMLALKGIGLAADLEQTTVAFETMLGSTEKAKSLLDDLNKFATSTPFQLPGLQQSAKTLLAFQVGQEEILPLMRALGDISAGTGKDLGELAVIFGQVKSKGALMGGELLQLSEAGVPIVAVLAKQLGVAESEIADMASKRQISFNDMQTALMSMSQEGGTFAGLMEKQSQTVGGLFSTLKDNVTASLRDIFTAVAPITKVFLEMGLQIIGVVNDAFAKIKQPLIDWGLETSKWIKVVFENFGTVWKLFKTQAILSLSEVFDFFKNVWDAIPDVAAGAFNAIGVGLSTWFDNVGATLQDILELFKTTFTAVRDFWLNLFTGEGLANSLDQAMTTIATAAQEKFNNQMKRNSDLINEVANAYDEAAGNIDLGKASPLTERLRGERDGLARDLAMARLALDQKKEEDKVAGAPQSDGEGGKRGIGTEAGMSGFADFGKKLQEQALKQDDKNQKAIISGIKEGNAIQRQQLEVAKDTRTKISQPGVGTLTGGK